LEWAHPIKWETPTVVKMDKVPLYTDPTPCQTCQALARTVMMDQTSHDIRKEWVGLTDDEMFTLWMRSPAETENRFAFARAIEVKLKEKNNG
jgi:hypothetical protein